MEFRLPDTSQRVLVAGRTGSGKTLLSTWLLSLAPFDQMPYVIFDYKREALLNSSRWIKKITYNDIPDKPGLYMLQPEPGHEVAVNHWLRRAWRKGNIGLYFDEVYNVPYRPPYEAFNVICMQGRSLRIPAIISTQRPAWLSRYALSEADHYAIFHLNDVEDRRRLAGFLPDAADLDDRQPAYHSTWYDVGRDALFRLQPVPDGATIMGNIETRLAPRRRVY